MNPADVNNGSSRRGFCQMLLAGLAGGLTVLTTRSGRLLAAEPAEEWDRIVDRALAYLRSSQTHEGRWGNPRTPGITGVVLTGVLQTGKLGPDDPMVERGLKYIESLINPQAGHIAGKDATIHLQNYVTCVNVLALTSAHRDSYKAVVADAARFLRKLQWDEGEGVSRDNDFYGGAGYDSKSRPDLSNTQLFLDALVAAGVPRDDPAFKNAMVFVSRCQNFKGEHNRDLAWAGKINDGSFIYSAAKGGSTKVVDEPQADGSLPGYGSMTYAGIKSLIYCGVSPNDDRIKKARAWIEKNYTLERNPGMPEPRAQWGLYYYYHTMAKCLSVMGVDEVKDADGNTHNWRADMIAALARRQRPDGSWVNKQDHWMEGNPDLVTGYALMALGYCKPRRGK
jgi:squalene-hopene/tetraprenyl-beta-curcumene cyclase